MAATRFSCFPWPMAEQLLLQHLRSTAAESLWTNPEQTAVRLHWDEGLPETSRIRFNRGEMALKICRICLKPVYRPEHDSQFVLGARAKRIFISRLERRAT
jgi:hypothetical protein